MKNLWVLIYDNERKAGEWFEITPFDEREETEKINENKTCFIQKVHFHNEDCLKIKLDFGDCIETWYYPVVNFSILQVETSE